MLLSLITKMRVHIKLMAGWVENCIHLFKKLKHALFSCLPCILLVHVILQDFTLNLTTWKTLYLGRVRLSHTKWTHKHLCAKIKSDYKSNRTRPRERKTSDLAVAIIIHKLL